MAEIKVYPSEIAPTHLYPRLILVFDEIETLKNLSADSSATLLRFSDVSSYEVLRSLASKVTPANDSSSAVETFLYRGDGTNAEDRVLTRVVVIVQPLAC